VVPVDAPREYTHAGLKEAPGSAERVEPTFTSIETRRTFLRACLFADLRRQRMEDL